MHGAAKVVGVDTNHDVFTGHKSLKAAGIPAEKYEIFHGTVEEYAADKDIKFDVMVSEIQYHIPLKICEYAKQASNI